MTQDDRQKPDFPKKPPLTRLRLRGHGAKWCVAIAAGSGVGLFLLTGLSPTPWFFLLYPLLLGGLVISLGILALYLLRPL